MAAVEARLAELGIELPEVAPPVAAYVPAVVSGSSVYTSGQLPLMSSPAVTYHCGVDVGAA